MRGRVDVALVGGGGAAMTLLLQLARHGPAGLSVIVIDPVDRLRDQPADRTWCYWHEGRSEVHEAVHRSWRQVLLVDRAGRRHVLDLDPLRYSMVRSQDLYRYLAPTAPRHLACAVDRVEDRPDGATVHTPLGRVEARYVFDSRPAAPSRPPRTALLQHFYGEVTRTAYDCFDPDLPTLMDFRTPTPAAGMSFGYLLPTDARTALVEYTEFSAAALTQDGYARAFGRYRHLVAPGGQPLHRERGSIPMTDAGYPRRVGRHVYRLGTSGGATRASTGYTFAAMLRQGEAVARALAAGLDPLPPRPYPRRHTFLDAVFLRALADGSLDGPAFFTRLFQRNPPARVLAFLDGRAGPVADLRVVASAPWPTMTRAALGDLRARAGDAAYRARGAAYRRR